MTLDIGFNEIGDEGAEYLANALQQNKVTRIEPLYFPFNHSLTIFYRHSSHLNSSAIKSVLKEHNIWRMLYNKIKYQNPTCSICHSTIH
jgi:hypothetical protein